MLDRRRHRRWLAVSTLALAVALAAPACAADPGVELTILHLNDLHARLTPDADGRGGFAQIATLLERERAAAGAHLTLHGGDMVQGTPVSTLFEGVPIFTVANGLGIDVHCLGNHEFDYGWEKIPEYVAAASFDTVSANVVDGRGELLVDPYVVREVGGLRVAVVGALTEDLSGLLAPSSLGPWSAAPLVATLGPVVERAATESDMVIVLGHLGRGEAEAILRAMPLVSLVAQGHPHRGWEEPLEIDGRIAVNASGYGRDVGRLRMTYDPGTRRILEYTWDLLPVRVDDGPADPGVAALVAEWEARASELVDVPIGRAGGVVRGDELMALIRAAIRDATGADLAYYNRGGIRDTLPGGVLLARHVWNVLPFDNTIVTTELSGRRVMELHEAMIQDAPIEGLEALDPDRIYRLATSDFSAEIWAAAGVAFDWTDTGGLMRDAVIEWVEALELIPASPPE